MSFPHNEAFMACFSLNIGARLMKMQFYLAGVVLAEMLAKLTEEWWSDLLTLLNRLEMKRHT